MGGGGAFLSSSMLLITKKMRRGRSLPFERFKKKREKKEKLFGALLVAVLVVPEIVMINPIELHSIKSGAC